MSDSDRVAMEAVRRVAEWAGLPCDEARARRLHPYLCEQKARMERLYTEDVAGFEFDFLTPRE